MNDGNIVNDLTVVVELFNVYALMLLFIGGLVPFLFGAMALAILLGMAWLMRRLGIADAITGAVCLAGARISIA